MYYVVYFQSSSLVRITLAGIQPSIDASPCDMFKTQSLLPRGGAPTDAMCDNGAAVVPSDQEVVMKIPVTEG